MECKEKQKLTDVDVLNHRKHQQTLPPNLHNQMALSDNQDYTSKVNQTALSKIRLKTSPTYLLNRDPTPQFGESHQKLGTSGPATRLAKLTQGCPNSAQPAYSGESLLTRQTHLLAHPFFCNTPPHPQFCLSSTKIPPNNDRSQSCPLCLLAL